MQDTIGEFGVEEYGEQLFTPDARQLMVEPLYEVLARSAYVSLTATLIASVIGIGLGTVLGLARLPGRGFLTAVVNTGMAVPTVVVGLAVALLLWRSGPLGDLGLIYTVRGMIIAQVLIATPLITGITMAALQLLPPGLPDQLRSLGANRAQLVRAPVDRGAASAAGGSHGGLRACHLGGRAPPRSSAATSTVRPR